MSAHRVAPVVALTLALLILTSGCAWFGGRGGGNAGLPDDAQEVELGDFFFNPETIRTRLGQETTLVLRNTGATIHNLAVHEFGVSQDVEVGRTETLTFTPNKTGTFRVTCDIPGHVELGMVGTLEVTP